VAGTQTKRWSGSFRSRNTGKACAGLLPASATEGQQSSKRQNEPSTRVDGVKLFLGIPIAADRDGSTTAQVAVLLHHSQYQEPGADDEGGTHKVTIDGIPACATSCFHLDDNAEFMAGRARSGEVPVPDGTTPSAADGADGVQSEPV